MSGSNASNEAIYIGPLYEQSGLISALHSAPRFGRSNDVTMLITEQQADATEYAIGAACSIMLFIAIFAAWGTIMLILHYLGPTKVGFMSGEAMRKPITSDKHAAYSRPTRVRLVYIVSGCIMIGFVFVFILVGLPKLDRSALTIQINSQEANSLIVSGLALTQSFSDIAASTQPLRDSLLLDLKTICPNGDFSALLQGLDLATLTDALDQIENFASNELETLNITLVQAQRATAMVSSKVEQYQNFKYFPVYWAPLFFFVLTLIFGTIISWNEKTSIQVRCAMFYVFMPCFAVWIFSTIIFTACVAYGAVVNADFCAGGDLPGSPTGTLLSALERLQVEDASGEKIAVLALQYFGGGCREQNPLEFLTGFIDSVESAFTMSNDLMIAIQTFGPAGLSDLCGTDIFDTVLAIQNFYISINKILDDANDVLGRLSCESLNKIYVQTFHQATCIQSVNAEVWILASLCGIATCGMIMIMLRSSLIPLSHFDPAVDGGPPNGDGLYSNKVYNSNINLTASASDTQEQHIDEHGIVVGNIQENRDSGNSTYKACAVRK